MSAIPELPQPGVEVIQEFVTTSPTAVAPTLIPCILGVCKEIHELRDSTGALNADILVSGPAIATAPTADTYTCNDETLQVRINGGVVQEFSLPSPSAAYTAQQVAAAINGATPAPVGFSAYVFDDGVDQYLELRTTGSGADQSIQITGTAAALAILGWAEGYTYYGLGSYIQDAIYLKQASFPDPRGNLDELDIYEDTIRAFLDLGTEVREILDSESFLRSGSSIAIYNDGDGDNYTPYVDLTENLLAFPGPASITGNVDLSTPQALHNTNLILQVDGGGKQTVTFYGQPIVSSTPSLVPGWTWPNIQSSDIVLQINGVDITITASAGVATLAALITEINTAVYAVFGVNVAYECGSDGEDTGSDYLGLFYGADPGPTTQTIYDNTEVRVKADASTAHTEIWGVGTEIKQLLGTTPGNEPIDDVAEQIDAVVAQPTSVASFDGSNQLVLASSSSGQESKIEIDTNSTSVGAPQPNPTTLLGLDLADSPAYGDPFVVRVGDYVYGDGSFLGIVTEIHSGAVQGRLRLDREVSISDTWSTWYIVAKNLDTVLSAQYGSTFPTPDLFIDTQGDVRIKQDFLRDTTGTPIDNGQASLYVMYEALRLDVTADAADPDLVTFDNTDDLEDALGPIQQDNPLAYGLFCALGNSGTASVSGLGIGAVSADRPEGTITAFQEAFDYLESKEVYAIASMTSELDVALAAQVHVDAMSEPDQKGERIAIIHLGTPDRKVDDIVVSGNDGDTTGALEFDTKVSTISQALLALGLNPASITIADGVFLDVAEDNYNWNVIAVSGTKVTLNTSFAVGENDDNFYATGSFPTIVSGSFSLKVRGALVTDTDDEIETIYNRGSAFADRRVWMQQLDQLRASINGVDQLISGYFMCAAKAGQVAGNNPSTPLTNFPVAVFTGVTGSWERYKNSQLNQGAAGGADWIIQDDANSPIYSRMQVTTDLTSIEVREQSIVKAIDYSAKFYRTGLRVFIGRYNITQGMLDTLSTVTQGLSRWLVEDGKVVAGADLNNLLQDDDAPDTVLVDVSLEPLYPCNTIRLTLYI